MPFPCAAESFLKRWSADAITAGGLAEAVAQVGSIIGDLATKLRQVDNVLYGAAHTARQHGVPIGPDGRVQPMITSPDATVKQAARQYSQEHDEAMDLAKGFRLDAASKLSEVYDQISTGDGSPTVPDQWVTLSDYLRGLYAIPDQKNRRILEQADTKMRSAEATMRQARRDLKTEKAAYRAKGLRVPGDNPAKVAHSDAIQQFDDLKAELARAEAGEGDLPLSRALNLQLGDVAREISGLGKIGTKLSDILNFAKDVPVLDIAAAGATGGLQMHDDMDKGWSADHAAIADLGSAALGLGTGAAIVAIATAPVALVAVGAGIAAVGVGDLAYQAFQENWQEDFHQHGAVGGFATGVGHVGENVGKDMAHIGEGAWHLAEDAGQEVAHGAEHIGSGVANVAKKVWDWL
ncbi:MAG TPA: hypothetical protein VFW65_07300 [Pseudonocardiaceae bacterium]|nr:hypothetical protein [Pseudonocardiaceae bacterium]